MKKVFSVLALVMMVVSLTGCMDSPDIGNKKPANYGAGPEQGKAN
jgi:predicted small lipoprotein YifL